MMPAKNHSKKRNHKNQTYTSRSKSSNKRKIHVVVCNVDYAGKDGDMLVQKREAFNSKYGTYESGQSGIYGWCDTYSVNRNAVLQFRHEYKTYWTSQHIKNIRVITWPTMSKIGCYLDKRIS